jgi:hypothetical protein
MQAELEMPAHMAFSMTSSVTCTQPAALSVRRLAGRWNSLGIASHLVARLEPFASFRSADLVRTLDGQIARQHHLFALEGALEGALESGLEGARVVGYLGWALYDAPVAARFAAGGAPPPDTQAHGKDVVWVLTAAALHPAALLALVRTVRAQHPGLRMMGVRHKASGKRVLFDRAARGPGAGSGA